MKLVIDIPEEQYSLIMQSHRSGIERFISKEGMMYAIRNATPLPKGHGRLIDADKIIKIITDVDGYERFENSNLFAKHYYDVVKNAPTIIDADKENDNEVYN